MRSSQYPDNAGKSASQSKELFRSTDEFGEVIVSQQGEKRVLSFASSLQQSSLLIERPHYLMHEYTRIMLLGLLFVKPQHITVLGLGGGGLVHCLHHFYPRVSLQVVELRQLVIDVAYEWFDLPENYQLQVTCQDAFDYLGKAPESSTNLILSDLYEADGMSQVQVQLLFIDNVYKVLDENGWLVINFHYLPDENSDLMQHVMQQFNEVIVCDVFKGNWVLFCGKSPCELSKQELKSYVKQLAQKFEMPLMYYFKQMRKLV